MPDTDSKTQAVTGEAAGDKRAAGLPARLPEGVTLEDAQRITELASIRSEDVARNAKGMETTTAQDLGL